MGLLDYYRQFEGLSEEEINGDLREQAAERKRKALTRVDALDLSHTTWPELPHSEVVSAITYVARRGLQRYPHTRGTELRNVLAERHGVSSSRLIIGNGAGQLLTAATRALIEPGQELLMAWPSYPLFPIMARRAHGRAVPIDGGIDALLEAAHGDHTRAIALASPNDPTGELLATSELERLLSGLPEGVALLLDESLVEFADAQPAAASIELLERFPRLLVFRSFSKAWGLAGLRVGYAIGGPGSEELLAELEPDLGVSEISQAGALQALQSCTELVARRARKLSDERARLTAALRTRGLEVSDSQANFLWVAHAELDGGELAARLERASVRVAPGAALGEPRHVRISVRDTAATDRLLNALDGALAVLPTDLVNG
ncbi:MAG TPA: aminotransferase class I/II-fold pyridoxal phosphate-dependent enzyme [Solirubrobacteraceae bacterium]|nr:aminotransferase class I/II-fold pyridoxal phosphate-dependent enzyme [Solirubrobacteraceae bacterium]